MDKPKGQRGGRRPGAGRPRGSKNVLALGEVRAIKACKLRLPPNASPELEAVAERAFERLVDVMEERVHHTQAGTVLKAAARLREEACGPLAAKVALTDPSGEKPAQLEVVVRTIGPDDED